MFEQLSFFSILIGLTVISIIGGLFVTVQQGTVSVVTMFGKYRRIMYPGLNFKIPFFEVIMRRVTIQNQSIELQFQALIIYAASVPFK